MTSQPLFLSRYSFLGRRIFRHLHHFHGENSNQVGTDGMVPRRKFLTNAAGAAGIAFWIPELGETGQGKGKSADPKPIPGGVSPLGIFIHISQLSRRQLPCKALANHRRSRISRDSSH